MSFVSRGARARRRVGTAAFVVMVASTIVATACAPTTSPAPTTTTVPPPVTGTAPPIISGAVRVGSTLATSVGSWTGSPTTFAVRWQSCDAAMPSSCRDVATGTAGYVVAAAELGRLLQVSVTATRGTSTATQVSLAVGPVLAAVPVTTSRAGVWSATGTRRLCGLFGSSWTCGTPSNVTLKFSLVGVCDGTGWCRLTDLTGNWGWSLSGGSTCMTAMGGAYQAVSGQVTATFTLDADQTIGVQAVVPQSAIPLTANLTDAHATRVGDVTTAPVACP